MKRKIVGLLIIGLVIGIVLFSIYIPQTGQLPEDKPKENKTGILPEPEPTENRTWCSQ